MENRYSSRVNQIVPNDDYWAKRNVPDGLKVMRNSESGILQCMDDGLRKESPVDRYKSTSRATFDEKPLDVAHMSTMTATKSCRDDILQGAEKPKNL